MTKSGEVCALSGGIPSKDVSWPLPFAVQYYSMSTTRRVRIRRLVEDLRQPSTRADAVLRVRAKAASKVRGSSVQSGRAAKRAKPTKGPAKGRASDDAVLASGVAAQARRLAGQATLAEALAHGESLEQAVCRSVADLVDDSEWNSAWALAEGVGRLTGGSTASALGHAVLLHRRRQFDRLWRLIEAFDDRTLAKHIPVESVDAALAAGTTPARERCWAIAAESGGMADSVLVDVAGRLLACGEPGRARELMAELGRRSSVELDAHRRHSWTLIEAGLAETAEVVPPDAVPIAVFKSRSPEPELPSGYSADSSETLALLGNLARFTDVAFTGAGGLGDRATGLQESMRPELRVSNVSGSVHLLEIDRDFNGVAAIPEQTWMFAFGWHRHPLFDFRYEFPDHGNIRPLFISFHLDQLDLLSDEAQQYLRRFGPVGCRDWDTVYLLLSAGIEAFFSGPLATTVDAVDAGLSELREVTRGLIAAVFEKIVTGVDEDTIDGFWREITREPVEEAKARFEAPLVVQPTTIDVAAAAESSLAAAQRFGPHDSVDPDTVTDLVLCLDQDLLHPAAVLLESIVTNATGPVRLSVLGRGLGADYPDWLAAAFPSVPMTVFPCDHVTYSPGTGGSSRRVMSRSTASTMDRLLVPLLLDNVHRIVYLDIDTLVLGDIGDLAAADLHGCPIAARAAGVGEAGGWRRAGVSLDEVVAPDLGRELGRLHGVDPAALNAGVLVMDLDCMRRDDFTATAFGWIEQFGLTDQETLLVYAGTSDRSALDPSWNAMPVVEDLGNPNLIHWANLGKPWEPQLTCAQDLWLQHAEQLERRAGFPVTPGPGVPGAPGLSGVVEIGPTTELLEPALERVINGVVGEHLSYLGAANLRTLASTAKSLEDAGIEGVIIETGTALGGSAITLAAAKSRDRRMRVYDVFGMIPPPSDEDGPDVHRRYAKIVAGESKGILGETYYGYREDLRAEVTESFSRHGFEVDDHHIQLIQGLFEDTLVVDEPVALAHLDGDWYASTMTCLTRIAPWLSVGGRIVIDDYKMWSGCRIAVDEYFANRPGYRFEDRGRLHVVRV